MLKHHNGKKVFVFLGYGFGADSWKRRFANQAIPGLNEQLPYGYYHAAGDGWQIEYSQDRDEHAITRLFRRTLGRVLGFDLLHAWRHRKLLQAADFVWTHTEREHLGVLVIYRLLKVRDRPKLIAQCVWLFDRWYSFSLFRRWFYHWLLSRADVITTQSPDDLAAARYLFPNVATELVLSGAAVADLTPPTKGPVCRPVRIAALGNDMHRDWDSLVQAFRGKDIRCEVRIASNKVKPELVRNAPHISIVKALSEQDVKALYEWADIVVVPLKFNLHASGITVVFEAIVSGVPVVCTDVGGIRAYFGDSEVCYVPLGSPRDLQRAVAKLAANDDERYRLVCHAQQKLLSGELTKQGYARRHRALSESLLRNVRHPAEERVANIVSSPLPRSEHKVRVFVHLAHGFGATTWRKRYSSGAIPGGNEKLPYGYFRAGDDKWLIVYSEDKREDRLTSLFRRTLQRAMGFDLVHAWRNREQLCMASIVWTHTEREHLAVLLLWRLLRLPAAPAIIAQCIWLPDGWPELARWKRSLYLSLMRQADLITTLSPCNSLLMQKLLPNRLHEVVPFGILSSDARREAKPTVRNPIRIASLGNDMHRDWATLYRALADRENYEVKIASSTVPRTLMSKADNVKVQNAKNAAELDALYEWADIVVVVLRNNSHASGVTVVLEAILKGLPVICSDTGGMRAYFSEAEVQYVPVCDAVAITTAIDDLAMNDDRRRRLVSNAQERMRLAGLTAQGFADRHKRLSERILFPYADQQQRSVHVA